MPVDTNPEVVCLEQSKGATSLNPLAVFAMSMFLSAMLLFLVEPMVAKILLPLLGGASAVWNTCMVFFQAVLLGGYLYAHAGLKWLSRRTQTIIHLGLVMGSALLLPLSLPRGWEPPAHGSPLPWLLSVLLLTAGLPFFLLASNTTILQKWFVETGHKSANDPYFLYTASNAGSLIGLLAYPLLVEPALGLAMQRQWWSYGYGVFILLTCTSAMMLWLARRRNPVREDAATSELVSTAALDWRVRLLWIALAFVPSSLMLGVTTELTSDVPAIPIFWVTPLAIYLVSFVLVFARRPLIPHEWIVKRLPLFIVIPLFPWVTGIRLPFLALLLLYLALLFAVAVVCHGELARRRPGVGQLTEFYLWISVGGVLGGIFNSLVSPLIFRTFLEFPLVLILAAVLRSPTDFIENLRERRKWDFLFPLTLGVFVLAAIFILQHAPLQPDTSLSLIVLGCSVVWCFSFGGRPLRFSLGLIALLVASVVYVGPRGQVLHAERSFFGISRVTNDPGNKFRRLLHGGTIHGIQSLDPSRSQEPPAYYSRSGPIGQVFAEGSGGNSFNVAIVGLGAGTMACYLKPGQNLTYYEIDPAVVNIARDTRYFTYLSHCAPEARIVLGDGRLTMRGAPNGGYDLIILDAFSGDSIPMHLLTREALQLYSQKLSHNGVVAFHISNVYLDLEPVVGSLAHDAGMVSLVRDDTGVTQSEVNDGKFPSKWVVIARRREDMGRLAHDPRWTAANQGADSSVWTDDNSNLLQVLRWK